MRRMSRRTILGGAAVGTVGIAALGLTGCGDDDDDTGNGGAGWPERGMVGEA